MTEDFVKNNEKEAIDLATRLHEISHTRQLNILEMAALTHMALMMLHECIKSQEA